MLPKRKTWQDALSKAFLLCLIFGIPCLTRQTASQSREANVPRRKLNTSIQRLIILIGEEDHKLAPSEVVAAANPLRRLARREALDALEQE